ncbi:MAG: hypothetical protein AAGE84_22680 [Cyanobacteria bacterium P01_G01_bin.39]
MARLLIKKLLNGQVMVWHLLENALGKIAVLIVSIALFITNFYIHDPIL